MTTRRTNPMIKAVVLVALAVQNASFALATRYSKMVLGEQYNTTTTLLLVEALKLLFSMFMSSKASKSNFTKHLGTVSASAYQMAIPAGLFFVQNSLVFVGLANLPSNVYTIFSQLKILTTAVFSVVVLERRLSPRKWRALLLLCCGVCLIQLNNSRIEAAATTGDLPGGKPSAADMDGTTIDGGAGVSAAEQASRGDPVIGLMAVLAVVTLSGFAGIYFEKVLKSAGSFSQLSVWDRNIQLASVTLVLGLVKLVLLDASDILSKGFFHGYSWFTFVVVALNAAGGMLVALAVKHADTIVKGFAVSGSIVLTSIIGFMYLGDPMEEISILGGITVIISVFNYNEPDIPANAPIPL